MQLWRSGGSLPATGEELGKLVRGLESRGEAWAQRERSDLATAGLLDRVVEWLTVALKAESNGAYSERIGLCAGLATSDVVAAGALRMLLAMECLEGLHPLADQVDEAAIGLRIGAAMHDTIAWPAFVQWIARYAEPGTTDLQLKPFRDEAEGMLEAWGLSTPGVLPLLKDIRMRRPPTRSS